MYQDQRGKLWYTFPTKIKKCEIIGKGSSCVVYKGLDMTKGSFLAFKEINLNNLKKLNS